MADVVIELLWTITVIAVPASTAADGRAEQRPVQHLLGTLGHQDLEQVDQQLEAAHQQAQADDQRQTGRLPDGDEMNIRHAPPIGRRRP